MPIYTPPPVPQGLYIHGQSDALWGFRRLTSAGVPIDISGAATVIFEVKVGATWVSLASKVSGIVWEASNTAFFVTIQASAWTAFTDQMVGYRLRDTWSDGADNVLAFGTLSFTDRA